MGIIAKKHNESYLDYRGRVVDKISPSFCGAKWYNATIWLGNGTTASCHHPPAHKIPLEEVAMSHKAIHNTQYKKLIRKQMLEGERPKECEYCWKIEDMEKDADGNEIPCWSLFFMGKKAQRWGFVPFVQGIGYKWQNSEDYLAKE